MTYLMCTEGIVVHRH